MTRKLYLGYALLALVPLLMINSVAQAQFSRVFTAAKTGSDLNSCNDVTTPCKSFAGAIAQVSAGGEVIALESGGYGPVTINKAVNINAPAGIVAFIHPPSGDALTINAGATDTVILRGLTLNGGTGNGINVTAVGQLFVEHCTITGYTLSGINFVAAGGTLFMRDDDVRKCGNAGLAVSSSGTPARAVIRDSYFAHNNIGVLAFFGSIVAVTDCVSSGNSTGFFASATLGANVDMTLEHVQAVFNTLGLAATTDGSATATLRFANSLVTKNTTGVSDGGGLGTLLGSSPGTSVVAGNGTNILGSLGSAMILK